MKIRRGVTEVQGAYEYLELRFTPSGIPLATWNLTTDDGELQHWQAWAALAEETTTYLASGRMTCTGRKKLMEWTSLDGESHSQEVYTAITIRISQ